MATKATPVITHVEILCRAIRNIEDEISNQESVMKDIPGCKDMLTAYIAERESKLNALKEMYRIETGTNYD